MTVLLCIGLYVAAVGLFVALCRSGDAADEVMRRD